MFFFLFCCLITNSTDEIVLMCISVHVSKNFSRVGWLIPGISMSSTFLHKAYCFLECFSLPLYIRTVVRVPVIAHPFDI